MANKLLRKKLIADILLILGIALIASGLFLKFSSFQRPITNNRGSKNIFESNEIYKGKVEFEPLSYKIDKFNLVPPLDKKGKLIEIQIAGGSTSLEVAHVLDKKGLFPADIFLKLVSMFELQKRIKAGNYTFKTDADIGDILTKIIMKGG